MNFFRFSSPISQYVAPLSYNHYQPNTNTNPKFQKIVLIASFAFLALSIIYLMAACCCCCKKRRVNVPQGGGRGLPQAIPIPVQQGNPIHPKANLQQPQQRNRNKAFKQPQALPSKEVQEKLNNLLDIEHKIKDIGSKLKVEQETLELSGQLQDPFIFDGMTVNELAIIELNGELEKTLKQYPAIFRVYLEAKFKQAHTNLSEKDEIQRIKEEKNEIHERISILSGLMKTHRDNQIFIHESLKQIELFLKNTFFTSDKELCFQEQRKIDLIVCHEFFTIVDEHYPMIEQLDPQLAFNLKIKLANLPLIDKIDRSKFTHVYLSDKDQLEILINHFQKKEDESLRSASSKFPSKNQTRY